jgi:hypothetical protein
LSPWIAWCGGILTKGTVLLCAVLGLRWAYVHAPVHDGVIHPADQKGAGADERSEIVEIWLPQVLYDLVNDEPEMTVVGSSAELRSRLKGNGSAPDWIAFRVRHYSRDGRSTDVRHFSYACDETGQAFQQCLDLLATPAGKPPHYPPVNFSAANVGIIPDPLIQRNPRDVLDELMPATPPPAATSSSSASSKLLGRD